MVALGYTMVYGILGLINFAHGEIVMIGAMISLAAIQAMTGFALPGPVIVLMGLLIAIPACVLLGYGIKGLPTVLYVVHPVWPH